MTILYAGARREQYDPRRQGMSFEYQNFFRTLQGMAGVAAAEFPFDDILALGKKSFRKKFLETVRNERPDGVFIFMYTDELDADTFDKVRDMGVPLIMWFADDYWRFWNYSRRFAPHATLAVTTSAQAFQWYKKYGIHNVLLSQWACNTRDFHPVDVAAQDIDVGFVGQYKAPRGRAVEKLWQAGIRVDAFGLGWPARLASQNEAGKPAGRLAREDMLAVFSRSKISLNIADRPSTWSPTVLARIFLRKSVNRLVPDPHLVQNLQAWRHFRLRHIHARPFELAGCGSFVISTYVPGIEKYYMPDKEMVFYESSDELARKVKYYLEHAEERQKIARAGYERTLRDHTYEKRLTEVFAAAGVKTK